MNDVQAAVPLLVAEGIERVYRTRDRAGRRHETPALRGVDMSVRAGGSLAIVGESGSGKSTLAKILVGLEAADAGTVKLGGVDLHAAHGAARRKLQHEIQMIFQDPYRSLNPRMTIRNALRFAFDPAAPRASFTAECERMLGLVRLPLAYLDRRPGSLSGGERQRVNIARALMAKPKVVVADEAVSALDRSVQSDVLNLIADLREEFNLTLVYITHDVNTVQAICENVIVLHKGLVVETGRSRDVMANPQEEYTRNLLEAAPTVERALELRGLTKAVQS